MLLEWNLRAQGVTTPLRPTAHGQARGTAMVAGAVYDAVNAIDRGHQPYLLDVDASDVSPAASTDAAVATAAHHVLVALAPQTQWATLDAALVATLAAVPDGSAAGRGRPRRSRGGRRDARLPGRRRVPGAVHVHLGSEPGDWRPFPAGALDPDAWVGQLRPFLIRSQDQFRSSGPNALTSAEYTKEFNEVKELGSLTSTSRTADQTKTAIFWQTAPAPLWHGMARDLITRHQASAPPTAPGCSPR